MPYSKMLKNIVDRSGLTSKEIVERCNKIGQKIDRAYLSKLLNNKVPAPSEEVSRSISKVCEEDERILVLEGYVDKAPKEIKEALDSIKFMSTLAALQILKNKIDKKTIKELEREMSKQPLAEFIIQLIDNKSNTINIKKNNFELEAQQDNLKVSLTEPIALPIKDNSMLPIIPKGSKVSLEMKEEYKNGDILAIKKKGEENFIVRYSLFTDDEIVLNSLNKDYKNITYSKNEIIILGKVIRVITEL